MKERELAVLSFLERYRRARGYPPTVREIVSATSMASTSMAMRVLRWLEAEGYVTRVPMRNRTTVVTEKGILAIRENTVNVKEAVEVVKKVAAKNRC